MSETVLIVLGAIGFLAVGGALGFWLARFRMRGDVARADEVREQFDDYRREVTQHFGRTAEHFKAIGREYRELYEHMSSGADSLCERDAVDVKLSFAPKAILESIAEEQQAEPQTPMDFEQPEQPVEPPLNPPEEPIDAVSEEEPVEALKTDTEAEAGDEVPRTLH